MIFDTIKTMVADHVEGSLIAQGYHFNVEGVNFSQFHQLFLEVYTDWTMQVDSLGEYIRILSSGHEYVNPSMEVLVLNKTVKSKVLVGNKPIEMCTELLKINDIIKSHFTTLFELATDENEQALADYCAIRLSEANKLNWKLVSITKGN